VPKIPEYSSQSNLKVNVDSPQMGLESVNRSERAQEGVINAIEGIEDTMVKLTNFRQSNEASVYGLDRINTTLASSDNDPENLDPNKYYTELDKIGPEAAKNISGQVAREEFLASFNGKVEAAKFKIRNEYRQRELNTAKGTIELQGQKIIDNPPQDLHDPLHNQTLMDYRQQYEKAIQIGLYTKDEANYKWGEFLKKVNKGIVYNDIANSPEMALEELQKGKEGKYEGLDDESRLSFIKDAEVAIKRNNKIFEFKIKQEQNSNYKQAMLQAFDGKLSKKSIEDLYAKDLISDTQRGKLDNYIYYNMPTVEEDDLSVYNQISQMQVDGKKSPEEINDIILENSTKNKLKNASAKQLLNKKYTDFKGRRDELIDLNTKEMRAVATEFFRDELDEPDNTKIETALYTFNRRIQDENANGERITQIAQEIITDSIRKDYPEINQIETINKVKEMFGVTESPNQEIAPPKNETQETNPFLDYPDAFKENGVWKVIRKGQKYRIEE
jgi:hypothetical protein